LSDYFYYKHVLFLFEKPSSELKIKFSQMQKSDFFSKSRLAYFAVKDLMLFRKIIFEYANISMNEYKHLTI
jgi:hypothetical protein